MSVCERRALEYEQRERRVFVFHSPRPFSPRFSNQLIILGTGLPSFVLCVYQLAEQRSPTFSPALQRSNAPGSRGLIHFE